MKKLILASSSPRRKELLEKLGLKFETVVSHFPEEMTLQFTPKALVKFLSAQKAKTVAVKYENAIIIGADTIVVCKSRILGKPKTRRDAVRMLRLLNGRGHSVLTGFTVLDTTTQKTVTGVVETKVFFNRLSSQEIKAYVASGEPLNKAGAYAIQGLGGLLVKKIIGDYSNIVGLPVQPVSTVLKKFGIRIL